jgi:hypothetical protein
MRIPRFGIGDLMVLVAVVTGNVAAVRAIVNRYEDFGPALYWLEGTMPIAVALQCVVLRLRIDRRHLRIFWIGILIAGIAGLASAVWHLSDPPTETITFSTSGRSTQIYSGGPASRLWTPYLETVYPALEHLGLLAAGRNRWMSEITDVLVFLLPQLLFDLTTGLLAQTIGKRFFSSPASLGARSRIDTPGLDARQSYVAPPPAWTGSIWIARIRFGFRHTAAVAAVLLIAMIASGMPGWFANPETARNHPERDLSNCCRSWTA